MTALWPCPCSWKAARSAKANTPTTFAGPSIGSWIAPNQRPDRQPDQPTEAQRYMYGHGFGLLFLSSVYGEEEDGDRRKKLEKILTKAVEFTGKAQTNRGGWGYVSAHDGSDFDEGSVTITQLQASVPPGTPVSSCPSRSSTKPSSISRIRRRRAAAHLQPAHGGAAVGGERPPLTAAAIACAFSAGEYNSDLAQKWFEYCETNIPIGRGRVGHDEYLHYYYAQAIYISATTATASCSPKRPRTPD